MKKTILVVDYEQKSLDEIQQIFKDEPFDLLMAFDGIQALQIFEQKCPDLVMTSALLPKLNGFELCKKIVSGQHGEVRPVIMFSGIYKAEKYRKEAIIGCGAVDFLEKPLAKWQLLKAVKALFSEIPGSGGGDLLDLNLGGLSTATMGSSARSTSEAVPCFTSSDDLLEVEPFLSPAPTNGQTGTARETHIVRADRSNVGGTSANALDLELEAAVDAVRMDLESASPLRDQQGVEEIEADLFQNDENILEFESLTEIKNGEAAGLRDATEVIEIEEPATQREIDAPAVHASAPDTATTTEPLDSPPTPQFAFASPRSRNWLPLLVTILIALLIIVLLWVRG